MIVGCYDLHLYCDGVGCETGGLDGRGQFEYTHEHQEAIDERRRRPRK